jgi:hypothetical protein
MGAGGWEIVFPKVFICVIRFLCPSCTPSKFPIEMIAPREWAGISRLFHEGTIGFEVISFTS